jgi:hypothetical protein
MRSIRLARWATCALAVSLASPVAADHHRSVADCTSFEQADKGQDAIALTITNRCTVPMDCTISWQVVCAPASKKRRAAHASTAKLVLASGASSYAEASAALCGDDTWTISDVSWSCTPNND